MRIIAEEKEIFASGSFPVAKNTAIVFNSDSENILRVGIVP
jgi:hypothetical protein